MCFTFLAVHFSLILTTPLILHTSAVGLGVAGVARLGTTRGSKGMSGDVEEEEDEKEYGWGTLAHLCT